jgi:FtsP/CotA-like multicopper oxidase with cupredoxin domain
MRNVCLLLVAVMVHGASAQVTRNYQVILRSNYGNSTMWDGNVLDIYGFAPTLAATPVVPGYTIYAEEGDSVIITARSVSQQHHHTIHLHGLDVDTRNDGDPATSFSLSHMQDTTYTFVAHHAGTYIYHCHVGDVVHVQMGMYALVIVKAAGGVNNAWTGGPAYDREFAWLMSEMDQAWHDDPPQHDSISETVNIPPYEPDYFLINGRSETQLAPDSSIHVRGAVGEKIYMRLANIGFNDDRVIFPTSLDAEVIDSDGRALISSIFTDTVVISPGERYGVMLSLTEEFTGSIIVEYVDMNTDNVLNTQHAPVTIQGFVGIAAQEQPEFHVSPLPTNGPLLISATGINSRSIIRLFDQNGRAVPLSRPVEISLGQASLDLTGTTPGTYHLQLQCGTRFYAQQIVVQ